MITTKEIEAVHIFEGMSINDIERVLKKTKDINVIDTNKDEET